MAIVKKKPKKSGFDEIQTSAFQIRSQTKLHAGIEANFKGFFLWLNMTQHNLLLEDALSVQTDNASLVVCV